MQYDSTTPGIRQIHHPRRGITRRDVLVTVVLAILLAMLLPVWLLRQRMHARRGLCEKRQHDVAVAIQRFEKFHRQYPGYRNLQAVDVAGQRRQTGWVFPVLPYLASKVGRLDPETTRDQLLQIRIVKLICPDDRPRESSPPPNWMSWVVNCGQPDAKPTTDHPADWPAGGVFLDRLAEPPHEDTFVSAKYIRQHDGLDMTLLLSENVDSGLWTDAAEARVGFVWVPEMVDGTPAPGQRLWPINGQRGSGDGSLLFARPSSYHPGGVYAVFCSGRIKFISQRIDYLVYTCLMTPDGENLKLPGSDTPVDEPYRVEQAPRGSGG